ncbi:MAG: hypothetical protein ACOCRU_01970 [bacterium]
MGFLKKLKRKTKKIFKINNKCSNQDNVQLRIDGLEILLNRCFAYDIPHEVTIVVPRAELRKRVKNGDREEEIEILLNSITVVHSPQRPSHEGEGPLPEPPEIPKQGNIITKSKKIIKK